MGLVRPRPERFPPPNTLPVQPPPRKDLLPTPGRERASMGPRHPKGQCGNVFSAIGALATQLGGAGMYFSPLIVRTPNETALQSDIKEDVHLLMYIRE